MKIGIDIDDTITETTEIIKQYQEKFNIDFCTEKEDFTNQEILDFYVNNIEEIQINAKLKPCVKEAFDELKKMGYEIIIITARGEELDYEYEKVTKEYFKKHNLPYDKMFFGNYPKGEISKKEGITLFVDDRLYNLDDVNKYGIECIHFTDDLNIESPYKKVNNWFDIIKHIKRDDKNEK